MWKRLPLRDKGTKGRPNLQIGSPTLLESTYDEAQLDRAQNLSPTEEPALSPGDAYYNADIRPSRARQDVENQLKVPAMDVGKRRSEDPTLYRPSVAASSVYSQPEERVSPPASPYRRPVHDDGQVSPIEEHSPSGLETSRPSRSQIPVPRKATPRMKEWTQNVGKGAPMMWDDYSGEPTFDGAGKPSQVKPGQFDFRSGLKPVKKLENPISPSNEAQKTSFKEKASRLAKQGLSVDTRPPWKGGSGRHAIVDAPQDKPGQPIPQPRRPEEKRAKSPGHDPLNSAISPKVPKVASPPETRQVTASPTAQAYPGNGLSDMSGHNANAERQVYGSVPAGPPLQHYSSPNAYPSPPPDRNVTPVKDYPYSPNPTADHSSDQHPALREVNSTLEIDASQRTPPRRQRNSSYSKKIQESPGQEPGSHFSWTTTATSVYQHSPPPSPPPPMPTKYVDNASPSPNDKASILDRGHPTRRLGLGDSPATPMSGQRFSIGSTTRKPVGSAPAVQPPSPEPEVIKQQFPLTDWRTGRGNKTERSNSLAPSTQSSGSSPVGKSLPKTPQELSSSDLIASIQAQQEDLSLQRRNIQRVIADLEKPEARNPIYNSFKVIREREKQLASLRLELDDVIRKDHELGMRLHRAWKRKERDDPNTPGSIFWVRRATAGM
ncbi:hypothetical protein, variant [Verruconis gallopava]|uniref:Uncharacterized protein n=1 Tax=Verruconis gallopava TaxID=253628 RepID=A0A0D1Z2P0_9PEZI|nr:hypothetical protein, variant [Verruconis gallopava]KIW07227.1 hypothetical protein, variant [Verruconis gallopava]